GPSGGRRSTSSMSPSDRRYVRFEWPPGNCDTRISRVRASPSMPRDGRGSRSHADSRGPSSCSPGPTGAGSGCICGRALRFLSVGADYDTPMSSSTSQDLALRLTAFMDAHIYPNERRFRQQIAEGDRWQPTAIVEDLKTKARAAGLWNLFLPESEYG